MLYFLLYVVGSGVDFDSSPFNLTFIPIQMYNETFNISITCDNVTESSIYHDFNVTIVSDNPLVYIEDNTAIVRIRNNRGNKFNYLNIKISVCLHISLVYLYPYYVSVREDGGAVTLELRMYQPVSQQFEVVINMINNDAIS